MKIGEWRLRSTIQEARRDCRSRAPRERRRDRPLTYHTLRLDAFTNADDDLIEHAQLEGLLEHWAMRVGRTPEGVRPTSATARRWQDSRQAACQNPASARPSGDSL